MKALYWLLGVDAPGTVTRAVRAVFYAAWPIGSVAFLAIVALAAIAVAALNLLPQNVVRWRTRVALTALRLAGFALLAAMLCQVELRLALERSEPPNVAVLTDVSGSMGLRDASGATRLEAARAFAAGPLARLSDRANLVPYAFDWRLYGGDASAPRGAQTPRPQPEGMTRLIAAVEEVARRECDLQAIILLTDGNDTAGTRSSLVAPLLASRGLPVCPVVFGSPGTPRGARVKVTDAPSYVRLGDEVRLICTISGLEPAGQEGMPRQTSDTPQSAIRNPQSVRVLLYEDGRKEPVAIRENVRLGQEPLAVPLVAKPTRAGTRTYRFALEGVRGAASARLLAAEHKVQVLDAKIRVLVVDIPRDERKIVAHWLARDPVVDLASLTLLPKGGWYAQGALRHKDVADGLPDREADLYQYEVIILGDIPRAYFHAGGDVAETRMQRLVDFVARRGGGLVTLGGQNVYAAGQYQGSPLAAILPFAVEPTRQPQVPNTFKIIATPLGLSHPIMQLAWDPQANRDAWLDMPTLDGCNRIERIKPGASLLAIRELSESVAPASQPATPNPQSAIPVMAIQSVGKGKVLSLAMDTTWRWEMMRPAEGEDHFRRFWGNAVRFLAPDPRIEPNAPQVLRYQSRVAVGETVTLATRLVDPAFRPIREADLRVTVTSPSGKTLHIYPRDGRDAPGLYEYAVTPDEAGPWQVATAFAGKTSSDEIVAGEGDDELDDPRARPEAMAELAKATGGRAFTPEEATALLTELKKLAPRRSTTTATIALWNLPATMVLMLALVAADCFIRKRRGMV